LPEGAPAPPVGLEGAADFSLEAFSSAEVPPAALPAPALLEPSLLFASSPASLLPPSPLEDSEDPSVEVPVDLV
jgi:hypothetical protein